MKTPPDITRGGASKSSLAQDGPPQRSKSDNPVSSLLALVEAVKYISGRHRELQDSATLQKMRSLLKVWAVDMQQHDKTLWHFQPSRGGPR